MKWNSMGKFSGLPQKDKATANLTVFAKTLTPYRVGTQKFRQIMH